MMSDTIRWGILGTGSIAGKFAAQLPESQRGVLAAVGSRRDDAAKAFCQKHGGQPHGSYEQLLASPDVNAIYVSLPNTLHHPWTLRALEAGKHVLCEKPLAGSRSDAEQMFDAAERHGKVLVEAFMYRTHPAVKRMIQLVREGAIGEVKLIRTHFTFNREARADDCRYQKDLAGGSLMDVGCYCINLARALTGREPDVAEAITHQHPLGVNDYAAGMLKFGDILCVFTCGMTVENDRTTYVGGSTGHLEVDTPWFADGKITVVQGGELPSRDQIIEPAEQGLYALEADAFAGCVLDGDPPWITREDTLGNLAVLDRLRQALAVTRPEPVLTLIDTTHEYSLDLHRPTTVRHHRRVGQRVHANARRSTSLCAREWPSLTRSAKARCALPAERRS